MVVAKASFVVLLLAALPFTNLSAPVVPNLKGLCHAHQKDLNIVFMQGISTRYDDGALCGARLRSTGTLAGIERFKYAIDLVNARDDLLPNISLGYVIMDTCNHDLAALAQTLYLLPDQDDPNVAPPGAIRNCESGRGRFKVSGIVGPTTSREAVMVGGLASLFQLPTLLTWATSDELSDKTRFKYIMRMVPPDRYQAGAILDFLLEFGWTYVTLLYSEGSYGENGAKQIERRAKDRGICIAYSHMVSSEFPSEELVEVLERLEQFKKARAVISFMESTKQVELLQALEMSELFGYFIWVGSDYFSARSAGPEADGAFSVGFESRRNPAFLEYFDSLSPTNVTYPWFRDFWEMVHDCRWDTPTGNESCDSTTDVKLSSAISQTSAFKDMDALMVFALGIHSLIEKYCPEVFKNKTGLEDCVTGERLLPLLLNVSFDGYNGRVKFDENGDFLGQYVMQQYIYDADVYIPVAKWDKETERIEKYEGKFQWHMYGKGNDSDSVEPPESLCSKPCGEMEYYIQKELPCCWECRPCRSNEIIVSNRTACQLCPAFMWPDQTAFFCEKIKPEVLEWSSPLSITLISFASLGIIFCLATAAVFAKNSHVRLIKASSRQLMAIILSGIATAYLTVYFLIMEPSSASCYASRFGFNLAVSLIYAPLMVKTNRIYRIFTAGKRGTKRPSLIGTRPQILLVTIFLILEVCFVRFPLVSAIGPSRSVQVTLT